MFQFLCLQGLFSSVQGSTIGVDFMIKTVEVDGDKIKVRNQEMHIAASSLSELN